MALTDQFRRHMETAQRNAERALRRARANAKKRGTPTHINVVDRTNRVVVLNVGGDGEAHGASATQVAPIHQDAARE